MTDPNLDQSLSSMEIGDRPKADQTKRAVPHFHIYEDEPEDMAEDPDKHSPELQLRRQTSGLYSTQLMYDASEVTALNKDEQSITVGNPVVIHDSSVERRQHEEVTSDNQSPGNLSAMDMLNNSLVTALISQPLVLTAAQHVPHVPVIVDARALATALAINPPQAAQAAITEAKTEHPPVFRRLGSTRPPPSTPPEPVTDAKLSMPTLPSLHLTSVAALIEMYRQERRQDPTTFDKKTMTIKEDLVRAKVERGGEGVLFDNEYTAELASRLDASAIERWSVIRQHDHQDTFVESDYEDEDAVYRMTEEDAVVPANEAATTKKVHDKDNVETATVAPVPATYGSFYAIDRAAIDKAAGTVKHDRYLVREQMKDGREKRTYETVIKITQIVDVPAERECPLVKPAAATKESPTEFIVADLLARKARQGLGFSAGLVEALGWARSSVKAAKEVK